MSSILFASNGEIRWVDGPHLLGFDNAEIKKMYNLGESAICLYDGETTEETRQVYSFLTNGIYPYGDRNYWDSLAEACRKALIKTAQQVFMVYLHTPEIARDRKCFTNESFAWKYYVQLMDAHADDVNSIAVMVNSHE